MPEPETTKCDYCDREAVGRLKYACCSVTVCPVHAAEILRALKNGTNPPPGECSLGQEPGSDQQTCP